KPPFLFIFDLNDLWYTSLNDLISSSDGFGSLFFTTYNHKAAIRNELVKRAASMRLQSSTIVSATDTNWFKNFCLKAKHQAAACLRPVYRILTFGFS
ncbi:hypothetical protein HID58_000919, partial [Brassica napus]